MVYPDSFIVVFIDLACSFRFLQVVVHHQLPCLTTQNGRQTGTMNRPKRAGDFASHFSVTTFTGSLPISFLQRQTSEFEIYRERLGSRMPVDRPWFTARSWGLTEFNLGKKRLLGA